MEIAAIRSGTESMADRMCEILELIEKAFMEHKTEILTDAMKKESQINVTERELTAKIIELSRSTKDKKDLFILQQAIEMLERMGDESLSIMERVEIKITEKLLFSDLGVNQFNETYGIMKNSVNMMRQFLRKPDSALANRIIDNGFHVKELVERYRKEHTERLVKGLCTPIAANMYFDMLDYTGNLARHASNIVKLF